MAREKGSKSCERNSAHSKSTMPLPKWARMLAVEQWLMILAIVLFLLALRCPTGRFVYYTDPEDDMVTCSPLSERCQVPFPKRKTLLVKRVPDEELLTTLEKKLSPLQTKMSINRPAECESAFRTAIIVPYRNRSDHLKIFLQHMHQFLPEQQIEYAIYVIEQSERHSFNRGKLLNIGFKEALKDANYCCFIFHDVDLLPENPQNMYVCSKEPRHMCVAIDIFRYVVPYADIFGGAIAMQKHQVEQVNGFSNRFFGWGAEDDDLALRIRLAGLHITRWSSEISRYTMLSHTKEKSNPERFDLLSESKNLWKHDGLSDLNYTVIRMQRSPLYTKITVDVKP